MVWCVVFGVCTVLCSVLAPTKHGPPMVDLVVVCTSMTTAYRLAIH